MVVSIRFAWKLQKESSVEEWSGVEWSGVEWSGSLTPETVKYGRESQGTRTPESLRWQGPAAYTKYRSVLASERAPH
jgi:hypothetical protein